MARSGPRFVLSLVLVAVMTLTFIPCAPAEAALWDEVKLQLLAVNDYHGQITAYNSTFGDAAMLAGYMNARERSMRLQLTDTWRLGGGDLIGASPAVSGLLQDEPTLKALDAMKFKYSAVGNHEFDEGLAELQRLQYGGYNPATGNWPGLTNMKYLAANVVRTDTGQPIFQPYAIAYTRLIPVGIIGISYQNTPSIVTASGVTGLTFLDEAATVNKYVAELKAKGVETIIVLLHDGGAGTTSGGPITGDIVPVVQAMDNEVDVVISSHSHARYWGYVGTKLVTQAYSAGRAFADIDLVISRRTGDVISKRAEIVTVAAPNPLITPDATIASIVSAAAAQVAPIVSRVVGTAASDMTRTQNAAGESSLGNLIADAQRWDRGTQIAMMNPGGIRADLLAGEVTWGELFAIQPFGNYMVTMQMTGAQIQTALEQQWVGQTTPRMLQVSGITYDWSASAPSGSKVSNLKVGGVAVNPTTTYTVAANNFLADGGDNFVVFKNATSKVIWGSDLDSLIAYVKHLPQPFSQGIDGRVTQLP